MRNLVVILEFARLIRRTTFPEERIFHRRFNEYFLALAMVEGLHEVRLDSIVEDRRDRDAIVLFIELCEDKNAVSIIDYCLGALCGGIRYDKFDVHATYALRFLVESFANRRVLLKNYNDIIFTIGMSTFNRLPDGLLNAKISAESIGLLQSELANKLVQGAINSENEWVIETSVRATRGLVELNRNTISAIVSAILTMSEDEFFRKYRDYYDIFRLNAKYRKVVYALAVRWYLTIIQMAPR